MESFSRDVWHQRLGHPSSRVLDFLPDLALSNCKDLHSKACEICVLAKQTRCSFPTSLNKTIASFDLMHCDVWGPYRTQSHIGARYFLTLMRLLYQKCLDLLVED